MRSPKVVAIWSVMVVLLALAVPAAAQSEPTSDAHEALPTDAALETSVEIGDAPRDEPLHVGFALETRQSSDALAAFVDAVSDPASPSYGQYLSIEQVRDRFGATQATVDSVIRELAAHGIVATPDVTHTFVQAPMSVAQAESFFALDLRRWSEPDGTQYVAPVPTDATPMVAFSSQARTQTAIEGVTAVAGLSTAPIVQTQAGAVRPAAYDYSNGGTAQGCPDAVATGGYTPNQFASAYGFDERYANGFTGAGQTIALLEIDGFSQANLDTYTACFGIPSKTPNVVTLGGGPRLTPGPETQLDVQAVVGMAPDIERIHIIESPQTALLFAELLAAALDPANTQGDVVKVFSMSLGSCENFQSVAATATTNQLALAAAATGVTVLVSSGDAGSIACFPFGLDEPLAAVSFPASMPSVTAVGGTNLQLDAANRILDERVWNDQDPVLGGGTDLNGGGGGYSVRFDMPAYQSGAGIAGDARVVPDVAMYADIAPGTIIQCDGAVLRESPLVLCPGWITVGGTSFAAPLLASAVVLANQEAAAQHKPTLGFMNPMLYREGAAGNAALLRDVTQGNNDITGGEAGCCTATIGFDPASGWGSVNAAELAKVGLSPVYGYLLAAADGGVFTFGDAHFYGSLGDVRLAAPIIGMIERPQGDGYWLVAADGGVFTFGAAQYHGSTGSMLLDAPVVGAAATPDGLGYWLVASDGGVFSFGSAQFLGSLGGTRLNAPIVGMNAAQAGGYTLVASDGGVFTFGDATFRGSTGGIRLNSPVIAMAETPTGEGYWLLASDGGVFTFGDARFHGSTGGITLNQPVVAFASTTTGAGYWLIARDGGVFTFGDAEFAGSLGGRALNAPIVAAVSA